MRYNVKEDLRSRRNETIDVFWIGIFEKLLRHISKGKEQK